MAVGNTGEHTEKLRDSNAETDPNMLNSVEDRLANLRELTSDTVKQADDTEENAEPTPEEKEEDQAGEDDDSGVSTPDKDDDSDKDGKDDKDGENDKDDQEDKDLPPAFLRAAVHRGWKEEDATKFFEENPDAAIRTFQNCYMDVNNASREWARIGKAKQDAGSVRIDASDAKPNAGKVDVDKLAKDYDLDDAVVEQLREQQKVIDSMSQEPVSVEPQRNAAADPNHVLQLNNFFGSEFLRDYDKFYGALEMGQNWNDLSGGQYDNRFRVLEQADLIILGAEASGQVIDPLIALERAHMVVSEPVREQVIRDGIKDTATKRRKSMTIRPSSGTRSTKSVASDVSNKVGSRSREELTTAVGEKLNNLFNS
ncbi:hypothetical protein LCGC14_1311600 [marine sediment metagenome]|uniref:Uncharacterized protein n=1 Tax=marine sediment metagenome TaxID=412755 RepID=A0A0F9N338_9ZZZZ